MTPTQSNALTASQQADLHEARMKARVCKQDVICPECGVGFHQARHWQTFCGDKCRLKWHAGEKDRVIADLRKEIRVLRKRLGEE